MMTKIRMLQTRRGTHDGYIFFCYEAGKVYNLKRGIAEAFIQNGAAELYKEPQSKKKKSKNAYPND